MYIRCKSCHGALGVRPSEVDDQPTLVTCPTCNQQYDLGGARKLRSMRRRLFKDATVLAKQSEIDLPGAYSVLLEIMTLREVRELGTGGSTACRTAATPGDHRKVEFDPEFAPAVRDGLLTERQAMERGERQVYATMLASRHRLSTATALDIADNRISLLQALRRRRASSRPVSVTVRGARTRRVAVLAVLVWLMVLAGLGWHNRSKLPPLPAGEGDRIMVGHAEVETDRMGRIIKVLGPTPRSVLDGFCRVAHPRRRYEALDVRPSELHERGRLGLLLDPADPDTVLEITILQDIEAQQWVAGDGRRPVVAKPTTRAARALLDKRK